MKKFLFTAIVVLFSILPFAAIPAGAANSTAACVATASFNGPLSIYGSGLQAHTTYNVEVDYPVTDLGAGGVANLSATTDIIGSFSLQTFTTTSGTYVVKVERKPGAKPVATCSASF